MSPRCPLCGCALVPVEERDGEWRCDACGQECGDPQRRAAALVAALRAGPRPRRRAATHALSRCDDPAVLHAAADHIVARDTGDSVTQGVATAAVVVIGLLGAATGVCGMALVFYLFPDGIPPGSVNDWVAAVGVGALVLLVAAFWLYRRLPGFCDSFQSSARMAATSWQSPAAVPALARLRDADWIQGAAEGRLLKLLPSVTDEHVARFGRRDLAVVASLLTSPPADESAWRGWNLVKGAAGVLGRTAYEPELAQLEALDVDALPDDVREAARAAVQGIRANLDLAGQRQTLLRAHTGSDADTLLRPADAGEEPQEQLLREADGPCE